jgi:hypothetical protein
MKTTCIILSAIALLSLAGCSGEVPADDARASEASALSTSNAATKKAIEAAFGLFTGGDAKRTHEIAVTRAPAGVASKLKSMYAEMLKEMSNDGWGSESELDTGVYEVFKTPRNHTVVGYAVWMYGDNGDAGRGILRGIDLNGREIVTDENSWAEE